jgi:hypothetical protein
VFKLTIKGDKEAGQFMTRLVAGSKKAERQVEAYGYELAEAASQLILSRIESLPTIGRFMAPRTLITADVVGGSIVLTISGMTEGEAGHPGTQSRGGAPPEVSSPEKNLWLTHEFGIPSDGSSELQSYVKDYGGVRATRRGRAYGRGSPYVGMIRQLVRSLATELNALLAPIGAIAATNVAADLLADASNNAIVIERTAASAMKATGVSMEALASLGVTRVSTTSRGQINLQGAGGRFVSGRSARVPTSIRR